MNAETFKVYDWLALNEAYSRSICFIAEYETCGKFIAAVRDCPIPGVDWDKVDFEVLYAEFGGLFA